MCISACTKTCVLKLFCSHFVCLKNTLYPFELFCYYISLVVNNFQSLNEELMIEKENVGKSEEIARLRKEFSFEISRHAFYMKKAR